MTSYWYGASWEEAYQFRPNLAAIRRSCYKQPRSKYLPPPSSAKRALVASGVWEEGSHWRHRQALALAAQAEHLASTQRPRGASASGSARNAATSPPAPTRATLLRERKRRGDTGPLPSTLAQLSRRPASASTGGPSAAAKAAAKPKASPRPPPRDEEEVVVTAIDGDGVATGTVIRDAAAADGGAAKGASKMRTLRALARPADGVERVTVSVESGTQTDAAPADDGTSRPGTAPAAAVAAATVPAPPPKVPPIVGIPPPQPLPAAPPVKLVPGQPDAAASAAAAALAAARLEDQVDATGPMDDSTAGLRQPRLESITPRPNVAEVLGISPSVLRALQQPAPRGYYDGSFAAGGASSVGGGGGYGPFVGWGAVPGGATTHHHYYFAPSPPRGSGANRAAADGPAAVLAAAGWLPPAGAWPAEPGPSSRPRTAAGAAPAASHGRHSDDGWNDDGYACDETSSQRRERAINKRWAEAAPADVMAGGGRVEYLDRETYHHSLGDRVGAGAAAGGYDVPFRVYT